MNEEFPPKRLFGVIFQQTFTIPQERLIPWLWTKPFSAHNSLNQRIECITKRNLLRHPSFVWGLINHGIEGPSLLFSSRLRSCPVLNVWMSDDFPHFSPDRPGSCCCRLRRSSFSLLPPLLGVRGRTVSCLSCTRLLLVYLLCPGGEGTSHSALVGGVSCPVDPSDIG